MACPMMDGPGEGELAWINRGVKRKNWPQELHQGLVWA